MTSARRIRAKGQRYTKTSDVAKELGISRQALWKWARKLGIRPADGDHIKDRWWSDDDVNRIIFSRTVDK